MIEIKADKFYDNVINMVSELNMSHIDAVIAWCELHNFEVEYAAELIKANAVLQQLIQNEAEGLNFLPKTSGARLPLYD